MQNSKIQQGLLEKRVYQLNILQRKSLLGEIQRNIEGVAEEGEVVNQKAATQTNYVQRDGQCVLHVISRYYEFLIELWQTSSQKGKLDTDVKSRIIRMSCTMKRFNFYYGVNIANLSTIYHDSETTQLSCSMENIEENKKRSDKVNLIEIGNGFTSKSQEQQLTFGMFETSGKSY